MSWRTAQIRKVVSSNFEYIFLALAVLALVGGYLTYQTHANPGTEVETFEDSSWSSTAEYSHWSVVQSETDVFDRGTVLENRPAYLTTLSPVLNGTFRYTYQASESGDLSVATRQTLVLRSVGENGEFEYWREETNLGSRRVASLQPGEQVTVPFSVNVTETRLRITEIEQQLGGSSGETEILVESTATISGQRNGIPVNDTVRSQIRIGGQDNVYRVSNGGAVTDSGQQTGRETVTATYGPLRTTGVPVVFVFALIGVVVLAVGRRQRVFDLSGSEREWLSYRAEAAEFSEWLSAGTIPEEALSRTTVRVETLGDLVDTAIDSNRRVIHDSSRGLCAVLLEETVYLFEPPDSPEDRELLPRLVDRSGGGSTTAEESDEDGSTTAEESDEDEPTTAEESDEDEPTTEDEERTEE